MAELGEFNHCKANDGADQAVALQDRRPCVGFVPSRTVASIREDGALLLGQRKADWVRSVAGGGLVPECKYADTGRVD
jgi:hypothetical protein